MEIIFAIGITMLFSAWIWTLKQEIGDLQKTGLQSGISVMAGLGGMASHATAGMHHHAGVMPERKAPRRSEEAGIPTWTIE